VFTIRTSSIWSRLLDVRIDARGQDVSIDGDPADVETVQRILEDFSDLFKEGQHFTDKELREAFAQIAEDRAFSLRDYFTKARFNPAGKKQVAPKSVNQRKYIQAIQEKDVVFGIGVAGTGKTYLAVAMAVQALMQKQVNRIVLARPAVEAGEKLGFLPGDLQDKVDPYLRPLYDALFDLDRLRARHALLEKRVIEVAPLAFMRGRTLVRRVHHSRRSAEHDQRTDEDVSDAHRLRLEGGDHRRRHAGRSADRQTQRLDRSRTNTLKSRRDRVCLLH
jgi:phosphate starvation-inducible PhoH-like protein